jgi:putative transposase
VNGDGEVLGVEVTSAEDGAGCLGFFQDLVARGLSGVPGYLRCPHRALGVALPGTSWQRCRTHYAANLMAVTPKPSWQPSSRNLLRANLWISLSKLYQDS